MSNDDKWRVLGTATVENVTCTFEVHEQREDVRATCKSDNARVVAIDVYMRTPVIVQMSLNSAINNVAKLIYSRARTAGIEERLIVQAVSQAHEAALEALDEERAEKEVI